VAVIKVGAPTESAQKELKQRVEDAVAATKAAMEEGIVPGGGMALFNISKKEFPELGEFDKHVAEAARLIMRKALQSPLEAIVENSGADFKDAIKKLEEKNGGIWFGFNAMTNELADLKEAGIIDPLKVTKVAFMNALSVAANYITVGAAVTDLPEKEKEEKGGGHMHEDY
jgi:chaperonin GroEL